jgi:hypothetical protein
MKMEKKKIKVSPFWEMIGYISLVGCVLGQMIVGYAYLFAQGIYLICNVLATIRCFAIRQPKADKVKNCVFTAISLGLIIIWVINPR